MATKSTYEKLQTALDSERVGQATVDLLGELSDVREWADALLELAENIDTAVTACEDYINAEGREEKADAKEEAVSCAPGRHQRLGDDRGPARGRRAGGPAVRPAVWHDLWWLPIAVIFILVWANGTMP